MATVAITKTRPGSISEGISDHLHGLGHTVRPFERGADLTNPLVMSNLFEAGDAAYINCAGATFSGRPDLWTYMDIEKVVSINLIAAMATTSRFVETTAGNGIRKSIVHVGSLWSRKHMTNGAPYAASKAGLAHYVSCIAVDLEREWPGEFTVVGVHPGNVFGTPMSRKVQQQLRASGAKTPYEIREMYEESITTAEIADTVAYVMGNRWMSGQNIYLGGADKR